MSSANSSDRSHLLPGEDEFDASAQGAANLTVAWQRRWQANPEAPVLFDADRGWITRCELEAISATRAGRLAAAGLRAGDRILISAESSIDLVASYVACLRMGLVAIPTNTAYAARELAHVIGDARPRAAIIDDPARASIVAEIDSQLRCFAPALDISDGPTPALESVAAKDPALICYTSGTTGQPKGAVLSHANCLASAEALRHAWRWTERDRLLLALPLFHMHGLGVGLHGTLFTGASAVLLRGFRPEEILAGICDFDATLFFGVPTMYHRLANHPEASALRSLRLCVSGSAPLPAPLHARIEQVSGQRVLERYGMTETLMLVSNPYEGERRPGSVGWPLPGVELRLAGEPAEIQVRGPNLFEGYWERPEANAKAFTADGWFRTGDLGSVDDEGYVEIVGRAKELIISGGFNVYPREVEDLIREHPDIEDVAVVGEHSEEWGERVIAYAVLVTPSEPPIELETLRNFIGDRLAAYKHPRALHPVDALPRNALGKVQKHRLAGGKILPEQDTAEKPTAD
jgi:malonyl-CoA/methylmalonyl-CoA synthetase